jgi:hypothetical protein
MSDTEQYAPSKKISSGQGSSDAENAEMSWRYLKDQLRVPTMDASTAFGGYMELPKRSSSPAVRTGSSDRVSSLAGSKSKRDLAHMGKRYLLALDDIERPRRGR